VFNLLNSGFIYVCGRDRLFRPIIVMRVHVLNEIELTPEVDEVIAAIFLNLKFVQHYMLRDGIVENLIQINDASGISLMNIPIKLMKGVLGFLANV